MPLAMNMARRLAEIVAQNNLAIIFRGNDRWYEEYVPRADRLYREHLETLAKEGWINGKKV